MPTTKIVLRNLPPHLSSNEFLEKAPKILNRPIFLQFYIARQFASALMNFIIGFSNFLVSIFFALGNVASSKQIFSKVIKHVFRNPMSFFDTTPNGRILSRLGKDIDIIDNAIPALMRMWVSMLISVRFICKGFLALQRWVIGNTCFLAL